MNGVKGGKVFKKNCWVLDIVRVIVYFCLVFLLMRFVFIELYVYEF